MVWLDCRFLPQICLLLPLAAAALLLLAGVSATELRSLDEMERSLYNPSCKSVSSLVVAAVSRINFGFVGSCRAFGQFYAATCATDADCTNYILFKRCRDWGTNLFGITVGFKCSVF